jgi:enoyl-CoA hydratase
VTRISTLVRYELGGELAIVTLDSPHNRNALSAQLLTELSARLKAAGADRAVRAVVLTHTGRVFCSGADLAAAGTGSLDGVGTSILAVLRLIVELPKPIIAQIAGHVRAGGMGIVGACDLAVAADGASFAFTEARMGLVPAIISLTTLDIMDPRQASRYCLTGETFGASAAARLGLITAACPAGDLDGVVGELVAQIRQTSPQGAAETKKLVTAARRWRLAVAGPHMAALSAQLSGTDDGQEGIRAFLEKRSPAWRPAELGLGEAEWDGGGPGAQVLQRAIGRSGRVVAVTLGEAGLWTTNSRVRRFGCSK